MPNNKQHTIFQKVIAAIWIFGVAFFAFGITTSNQSNVRYLNGEANIFSLNIGEGTKWLFQRQIDNMFNPDTKANDLGVFVLSCSPLGCLPWIVEKILKVIISAFVKAILNTIGNFIKKVLNDLKKAAAQFNLFSNISGPARGLMDILSGRRNICGEIEDNILRFFDNFRVGQRPSTPLELGLKGMANRLNSTPLAFATPSINNGITNVASMFQTPITYAVEPRSDLDKALERIGAEFNVVENQSANCKNTFAKYDEIGKKPGRSTPAAITAGALTLVADKAAQNQPVSKELVRSLNFVIANQEQSISLNSTQEITGALGFVDPAANCKKNPNNRLVLSGFGVFCDTTAYTFTASQVISSIQEKAAAGSAENIKKIEAAGLNSPDITPVIANTPPPTSQPTPTICTDPSTPAANRTSDANTTATATTTNPLTTSPVETSINKDVRTVPGVDLSFTAPPGGLVTNTPIQFTTSTAAAITFLDNKAKEPAATAAVAAATQKQEPNVQSEDFIGAIIDQVTTFLQEIGNLLIDTLFSVVNTIAGNICSNLGITQACTELASATSKWSDNLKADLDRDIQVINASLRNGNVDLKETVGDNAGIGPGGDVRFQQADEENNKKNEAERETITRLNNDINNIRRAASNGTLIPGPVTRVVTTTTDPGGLTNRRTETTTQGPPVDPGIGGIQPTLPDTIIETTPIPGGGSIRVVTTVTPVVSLSEDGNTLIAQKIAEINQARQRIRDNNTANSAKQTAIQQQINDSSNRLNNGLTPGTAPAGCLPQAA